MAYRLRLERRLIPEKELSEVLYPPVADDDKDAVLWVASFHRHEWNNDVLTFRSDQSAFIRSAVRSPFPSTPEADMGNMNNLPLEIVWNIFSRLDLLSLLRLRQVNRRARQIVTAMPAYRLVTRYALDVCLGLYKRDYASLFTLAAIQAALGVSECGTPYCPDFPGHVHLRTLNRYCYVCAQKRCCASGSWSLDCPYRPLLDHYVVTLQSFPWGTSAPFPDAWPSNPAMEAVFAETSNTPPRTRRCACTSFSSYSDPFAGLPPVNTGQGGDCRYLNLAPMPHIFPDAATGRLRVDYGVSCTGCYLVKKREGMTASDSSFVTFSNGALVHRWLSRGAFLDHFRSCREAQRLWEKSRGGTVAVELDEADREMSVHDRRALARLAVSCTRAKELRKSRKGRVA